MLQQPISFRRTNGGVGAFVENIDLSQPLPIETSEEIKQSLGEYGVLFSETRSWILTPIRHLPKSWGLLM